MSNPSRLGGIRKCSPPVENRQACLKSKKKSNRNPLKDLNTSSSSTSTSAEGPRGCFRFLLSNSSSKSNIVRTPKSAPVPSNHRSRASRKTPPNPNLRKPTRSGSEDPQRPGVQSLVQWENGKKPTSLGTSGRQLSSGNGAQQTALPVLEKKGNPVNKLPSRFRVVNPSLSDWEKGGRSHSQAQIRRQNSAQIEAGKAPSFSFMPSLEDNGTPLNKLPSGAVSEVDNTPVNKLGIGSCSLSTPDTNTPPLLVSVSPEIPSDSIGGPTVTPACFAAGHVLVGVSDQRKCRPRGILTVKELAENGGICKGMNDFDFLGFSNGGTSGRPSLIPSPPEASINWISSPNEKVNCSSENGLVSPTGLVQEGSFTFTPSSGQGFSKAACGKRSLEFEGLIEPSTLVSEATPPSSGQGFGRSKVFGSFLRNRSPEFDLEVSIGPSILVSDGSTPSSSPGLDKAGIGGGINEIESPRFDESDYVNCVLPHLDTKADAENGSAQSRGLVGSCTLISEATTCGLDVCRVSAVTSAAGALPVCVSKGFTPQERYRYDLAVEGSPFSGESWGSQNVMSTPMSNSSLEKQLKLSWMNMCDHSVLMTEMNSMKKSLNTLKLSPKTEAPIRARNPTDVLPLPGLNFQISCPFTPSNSLDGSQFKRSKYDQAFERRPEVRISWREGLVSRIFEMDEDDCCQWLSEDEDKFGNCRSNEFVCNVHFGSDYTVSSSILTKGNEPPRTNDFGSPEFVYDKERDSKATVKAPPLQSISCAESISTDGGGLVASGDSDWTLCYKNQLFEV